MPDKQLLIRMPVDMHTRLKVLAAERGTTIAAMVRGAIDRLLAGEGK